MLPEDIFPYPSFRQGQLELARSVYHACKSGERLVAEAMSGFGKTAAVLAGTLPVAEEEDLQVIYACRTKRQVFRVLEELNRFAQRTPIRATSLFSKYDYCLLRQGSGVPPETFKWYCSFHTSNNLCSYFMNVPFNQEKIWRLAEAQTAGPPPISELLRKGTSLHVCPYEITRLCLARSRVVVTTYHYLLDGTSRSVLLSGERPLGKVIAIVDEAHNIRDFVSGNSTVSLFFSDIRDCVEQSSSLFLPGTRAAISQIAEGALRYCSRIDHWQVSKESFVSAIAAGHPKDWLSDLVFELSTNSRIAWYSVATGRSLPASIIRLGDFLSSLLSSLDSGDVALVKSDSALFLVNTDPAKRFLAAIDRLRSLVLLSATINPPKLFIRSIGLDESSTTIHSALTAYTFRVRTVIDSGVSTRFKLRNPQMFSTIARRIAAVCASTQGGIGVFLPSYAVLDSIKPPLSSHLESLGASRRTVLVERPGLTNDDSDQMMSTFKSKPGSLLLAVQGGRFSEGEDFPGDEMDVSMVVGLPLSPPSPTIYADYRRMEADNFDKHEAYMVLSLLPALRKSLQCAGRHIRRPGKVGMVCFMDSRFAQQTIIELMPQWLKQDLVKGDFGPDSIASVTREFFATARAR